MIENIISYQIVLPGGKEKCIDRAVGFIHGWNDKRILKLTCHFHADCRPIPENSISKGVVQLHYPMQSYAVMLDVFRNEAPLTVMFDEETLEGQITTSHERVGKLDVYDDLEDSSDVIYRRFDN